MFTWDNLPSLLGGGGGGGGNPTGDIFLSLLMRLDWNNILLLLFSVLTALNLICGIWASSIILDRHLGSFGLSLHFELASGGRAWDTPLIRAWRVGW